MFLAGYSTKAQKLAIAHKAGAKLDALKFFCTKYLHLLKRRGMCATRHRGTEHSDNTIALEFDRSKP